MPDFRSDPLLDIPAAPAADRTKVDEAFFDRVYDAQVTLKHLRARPLLGPDRTRAPARVRLVASVLQELPDDAASADLFRIAGDLALESGHGEAVDRYLRGAAAARRRRDAVRQRDLHLRACRAVARMRSPEAAMGFFEELGTMEPEPCPATFALTCADLDPSKARHHLETALIHLTGEPRAHERLMALEDLAEAYIAGNEPTLAQGALTEAIELSSSWSDTGRAGHAHGLLATIHLTHGQPDRARASLEQAFEGAIADQDDLLTITNGTVLTALYLEDTRYADAESVARRVLAAAERRGNWLGVADASLAWSATYVGQGQHAAAVAVIARTLLTLRAQGAASAAALLHARLGELRFHLGAETFDPILQRVMAALRRT